MAILIVEHNGTLEGASLSGRILIGRRPSNHVVIDDPSVSRIHAWIDTADRQFCVTDAGSRTGTFVNGQRVSGGKVALRHGDRIHVGPASLIFRTDASLPAGVSQLNFGDRAAGEAPGAVRPATHARAVDAEAPRSRPASAVQADGGILFDCPHCHAPLWIAAAFAGRRGKCRFCGAVVQVPRRPGVPSTEDGVAPVAPPVVPPVSTVAAAAADAPRSPTAAQAVAPAPPAVSPARTDAPAEACGACQSQIEPAEPTSTCPDCGLTFHADCWTENYGCSAYGCSQVNALLPEQPAADAGAGAGAWAGAAGAAVEPPGAPRGATGEEGGHAANAPKVTAEYALLAAGVVGVALGALTFGVPALLACGAAVLYMNRRRAAGARKAPRVVVAAALLALAGAAAGAAVSYVWWFSGTGAADVSDLPAGPAAPEDPGPETSQP